MCTDHQLLKQLLRVTAISKFRPQSAQLLYVITSQATPRAFFWKHRSPKQLKQRDREREAGRQTETERDRERERERERVKERERERGSGGGMVLKRNKSANRKSNSLCMSHTTGFQLPFIFRCVRRELGGK